LSPDAPQADRVSAQIDLGTAANESASSSAKGSISGRGQPSSQQAWLRRRRRSELEGGGRKSKS